MKKRSKSKSSFAGSRGGPDIAGLILKVQQQLSFLEKKIDALIGQSAEKPSDAQPQPKPFQRFDNSSRRQDAGQGNNYSQRVLHKAICADCNKECEVPFRPSQDRPVYCRDCFSKRKARGPFKGNADHGSGGPGARPRPVHFDKPQAGEKKKFFEKKRPAVKKRKSRA